MLLIALIHVPGRCRSRSLPRGYANDGYLTRFIQLNIANLAGVPRSSTACWDWDYSSASSDSGYGTVLAAAFTVGLLILPIIIIAAQEAIRAVPDSQRQASYGMGGDEVADDSERRPATSDHRHHDRNHSRARACHRRDGAADHDRRADDRLQDPQ